MPQKIAYDWNIDPLLVMACIAPLPTIAHYKLCLIANDLHVEVRCLYRRIRALGFGFLCRCTDLPDLNAKCQKMVEVLKACGPLIWPISGAFLAVCVGEFRERLQMTPAERALYHDSVLSAWNVMKQFELRERVRGSDEGGCKHRQNERLTIQHFLVDEAI